MLSIFHLSSKATRPLFRLSSHPEFKMPKRRKQYIDTKTSTLSWEPQLQTRTLLNRCVNTSPFGIQIPTHFSQYYFSQNHNDFNACPVFCKAKGIIRVAKLRIIRQRRQSSLPFSKVLAKKKKRAN